MPNRYDDERLAWVSPSEEIDCASCIHRLPGKYGYQNSYCEKFKDGFGKPNGILFYKEHCKYYTSE